MKRILIITSEYPPKTNGISTYTYNLVSELRKKQYNVKLIDFGSYKYKLFKLSLRDLFYTKATKDAYFSFTNILNSENRINKLKYFIFANMIMRVSDKIIKEYNPDIIHLTVSNVYSSVLNTKKPVIITFYSEEVINIYPVKYIVNRANLIYCISNFTRNLVLDIFSINKAVQVIPCSIDTKLYKNKDKIIDKRMDYIISVGRLSKEKNYDTTIKAYEKLPNSIKGKYKFLIIGEGDEKNNLIKLIKELRLENKIILLGKLSEKNKIDLLKQSKLFLLCPRIKKGAQEGFGIVFLEAQAAGLPIITSNIGGIKEAVGNAGLFIDDPENPKEIADKLMNLISNQDLTNELVKNAQNRINEFDHSKWIMHIEELYNKCINNV